MRRDSMSLGDIYSLIKRVAEETVEEKLGSITPGGPLDETEEEEEIILPKRRKRREAEERKEADLNADTLATVLMTVAQTQQEILKELREQHRQNQETTVRVLEAMGTVLQQLRALPSGAGSAPMVTPPPDEQAPLGPQDSRPAAEIPSPTPTPSAALQEKGKTNLLDRLGDYLQSHIAVTVGPWEPAQTIQVLGQENQVYMAEGVSDGGMCRIVTLTANHISSTDVSVFYNKIVRELMRTVRSEILPIVIGETLEPKARRTAIYYGILPLTLSQLDFRVG
ncbi:MAG: hypothetical protein NZ959_08730 [Armatimonadetes bacterium]|nr:hypothetical protein [Armatimonadota bacterium]MDW8122555.1 hypothetical protein [Armatimonadota bacterium]